MLYENEVVMLLLGTGVILFVELNRPLIRRIFAWKWLLMAFYFLMAGWGFTVIEGFIMVNYFNLLEHISYTASALIMAFWCRKIAVAKREEQQ